MKRISNRLFYLSLIVIAILLFISDKSNDLPVEVNRSRTVVYYYIPRSDTVSVARIDSMILYP